MSIQVIPSKEELEIVKTIAAAATDSAYFKNMGGFPGILSIALYAKEMGIPPLSALFGGMQNVMGKIQMSPEMMMSLIRGKGHKIEILEDGDEICKIRGTRKDTGETYTASYSIREAQLAGLVKPNSGWAKNPSDMLFARASGRLKRRLFPDIATKAYCEGELEEATESKTVTIETATGNEKPTVFIDLACGINGSNHVNGSNSVVGITTGNDYIPGCEGNVCVTPAIEIPLISSDQAQILNEMIGEDKIYYKKLIDWLKIEALHQLPLQRYQPIFNAIEKHNQDVKKQQELN